MNSIVLEIQQLASDSKSDVLEVLRKTMLAAHKLHLDDMKNWCEHELNGYTGDQTLPQYRSIPAEIKAESVYGQIVPALVRDPSASEMINVVHVRESIPLILDIIKKSGTDGTLEAQLNAAQQQVLQKAFRSNDHYFRRIVSASNMANIVEQARNAILAWSLELESKGILGEGISFSQTEKDKAASAASIRIENFHGVFGDVKNSTIHQSGFINIIKKDFDSLKSYLESTGVNPADIEILKVALDKEKELAGPNKFGPKVAEWIGKMVAAASSGAWQIGIGAAGNILATAIQKYYGMQ